MVIAYLHSTLEAVRTPSPRYHVLLAVNMGKAGGSIRDTILAFYYTRMYYALARILVERAVFLASGGFCEQGMFLYGRLCGCSF